MRILRAIFSLCIIVAIFYSILSVRIYRVSGDSMNPLFLDRDIVIVDRISRHFAPLIRGEIIVFHDINSDTPTPRIKRIIGLPGETITITSGAVILRERILSEPYLGEHIRTCVPGSCTDLSLHTFDIPDDSYFVLGDRRLDSVDSRGCTDATRCDGKNPRYILADEILGRIIFSI